MCTTLTNTPVSALLAVGVAEYVLNLVPPGTHSPRKFVTPAALDKMLRNNGLSVTRVEGMDFNPLLNKWSITGNNIRVNYALVAQKPDILPPPTQPYERVIA